MSHPVNGRKHDTQPAAVERICRCYLILESRKSEIRQPQLHTEHKEDVSRAPLHWDHATTVRNRQKTGPFQISYIT